MSAAMHRELAKVYFEFGRMVEFDAHRKIAEAIESDQAAAQPSGGAK